MIRGVSRATQLAPNDAERLGSPSDGYTSNRDCFSSQQNKEGSVVVSGGLIYGSCRYGHSLNNYICIYKDICIHTNIYICVQITLKRCILSRISKLKKLTFINFLTSLNKYICIYKYICMYPNNLEKVYTFEDTKDKENNNSKNR